MINSGDVQERVNRIELLELLWARIHNCALRECFRYGQLNRAIEEATNQRVQEENTKKQNSQFQGEIRPQDLSTP